MKDAYSFDRDDEGLAANFELQRAAYVRVFERCGLSTQCVEAEPGMMGGSESFDFLAPAGAGENTLVTCENGDFAADVEIARGVARAAELPAPLDAPAEVETPGVKTCEALAEFLAIDVAATSKAMPVTTDDGVVLALVRGDDRIEPAKLDAALGKPSRPATDEEIRAAFGASGGSLGPVGFKGEVVADEALRDGQFVAGANRDGWHLRGVEAARDFEPRFADLRQSREGDTCPNCGGRLLFETAIEVGHIFKLGTRYSAPLGATFVDEDGQERPLVMGSYGIGLARVMASLVEQSHDENGIIWPASVAPYDVHVLALRGAEEIGAQAAEALSAAGKDVLLDDRDQRPGEKFADADLIGIPIRVTAGKKSLEDGAVDVSDRATGEERRVKRHRHRQGGLGDGKAQAVCLGAFGAAVERLMNETGVTYRALAAKTGSLRRVPEPPRPRQPPGALERRGGDAGKALGVDPEYFREYRLRVITEKLEAMPDLVDRLYKRLNG